MALLALTLEKGSHELKSHTLDQSVEDQKRDEVRKISDEG